MEKFNVLIPEENYSIFNSSKDDLPAIIILNSSLVNFEPKEVFSWNLSIVLRFNELSDNGMPTKNETDLIESFEKNLDEKLKINTKKPNALFLARITWNGTREYLYRIHDPKMANKYLQNIIDKKIYPRDFEFRMEDDKEWEQNEYFLNLLKNNV